MKAAVMNALALKYEIILEAMKADNQQHPEDQPFSGLQFFQLADELKEKFGEILRMSDYDIGSLEDLK